MEQDFDGFGIGSHDDEFTDTTVEGLYIIISSQKLVVKKRGKGEISRTLVASLAPFLSCL